MIYFFFLLIEKIASTMKKILLWNYFPTLEMKTPEGGLYLSYSFKKFTSNQTVNLNTKENVIASFRDTDRQDVIIREVFLMETLELKECIYENGIFNSFRFWERPEKIARVKENNYVKFSLEKTFLTTPPGDFFFIEMTDVPLKNTVQMTLTKEVRFYETFYPNGNRKSFYTYLNNSSQREGPFKKWREDGNISVEGEMLHGKREGVVTFYTGDGSRVQYTYENDNIVGVFSEWTPENVILRDGYIKNPISYPESKKFTNKINGLCRYYYDNGKIKESGFLKDGLRDNLWIFYNRRGVKLSSYTYKDDKKNGTFNIFNVKGNISTRGEFVNDVQEGKQEDFYEFGELKSITNYVKGIPHGIYEHWDYRRNVKTEVKYENGIGNPYIIEHYLNNNSMMIKNEGNIIEGKKEGIWKFWARNGYIYEEEYKKGEKSSKRRRIDS